MKNTPLSRLRRLPPLLREGAHRSSAAPTAAKAARSFANTAQGGSASGAHFRRASCIAQAGEIAIN